MSRRLRRVGVSQLLQRVMQKLIDLSPQTIFKAIDSMPLRVGNYSNDRDAKRGRAAGAMARGYKLHAITSSGAVLHWTLTGMNRNDQTAAHDLLARLSQEGYQGHWRQRLRRQSRACLSSGGCTPVDCSAT